VAKPSFSHSAAKSLASFVVLFSGLLTYLLLPMQSATWVPPSGAGFVYMPLLSGMVCAWRRAAKGL
jgi:hypothetical protein